MIARPVQFRLSEYLGKGFDLLKKDYINFVLAYFFCMLLSLIPFCSLLAIGNFYKYCKKIDHNEQASPAEIFNFDDFVTYFVLNLIFIAGFVILYIPMIFFVPAIAIFGQGSETAAGISGIFMFLYLCVFFVVVFLVIAKAFYLPGLISLKGITDFKEAWRISNVLTKGNLILIILFAIITAFLGQLGIVVCGIGLFFTLPYVYTSNYVAYRDAFQQISTDEIKEIGNRNY